MNIKQAINELEEIRDFEITYSGYRDALNIAIEALKEKEAAELNALTETDPDTAECINTKCTDCEKHDVGGKVCDRYPAKTDEIRRIHEEAGNDG